MEAPQTVRTPGPGQQTLGSLSPGGLHAAPGAGRTQAVSQPWPPSNAEGAQGHCWPTWSPRPAERGERLQLCLQAGAKQSFSGPAWLEGPWSWKPCSIVGSASRVRSGPCPTLGTRPARGPGTRGRGHGGLQLQLEQQREETLGWLGLQYLRSCSLLLAGLAHLTGQSLHCRPLPAPRAEGLCRSRPRHS